MKIYDIFQLYGWDEHAALTQKTYGSQLLIKKHFTVTIEVALRSGYNDTLSPKHGK